jgi:beta-glucosidase/6-phospho-beta-glucosidase/beta-galactosidase
MHPITYGDYPPIMRAQVGERLPKFTEAQAKMLTESIDFLGMNYYTSNYASPVLSVSKVNLSYMTDYHVDLSSKFE